MKSEYLEIALVLVCTVVNLMLAACAFAWLLVLPTIGLLYLWGYLT